MKTGSLTILSVALATVSLLACDNEAIRRNDEIIRRQEEELATLRAEQRYQECRRAFLYFEQAQVARDPREAESRYREGLQICPDDDVAHYELGRILADAGRRGDARDEFEAALRTNPNFTAAREELDRLNRSEGR
jgi:tetratricopeptide (TPR) repeat protein